MNRATRNQENVGREKLLQASVTVNNIKQRAIIKKGTDSLCNFPLARVTTTTTLELQQSVKHIHIKKIQHYGHCRIGKSNRRLANLHIHIY